jgi:hypothetical protein
MSSARTSSASNASGRPAPAARPVFSFSTQRPRALLPRAFASGSRFDRARWWGEIIVPAATGAATTSHAWSLTPAAHMLLARDVAADLPRLARIRREREQVSMDAASCSIPATKPIDTALCSALAITPAWLLARTETTVPEGTTSACAP